MRDDFALNPENRKWGFFHSKSFPIFANPRFALFFISYDMSNDQHNNDPFNDEFQQDPFIEDHFGSRPESGYAAAGTHHSATGIQALPESTAVLVLGILSILGSFCYGIPGLILGIIAVAMAVKPDRVYKADPSRYTATSYNNMKAGKICGIVGICLSALILLIAVIAVVSALNSRPSYYY